MSMQIIRLMLSGMIAFFCYAGWAYYANSLVTSEHDVLIKAALVQGVYSACITLVFTFLLEYFFSKVGANYYCLVLIVPRINSRHSIKQPCSTLSTFAAGIMESEQRCNGSCLPGIVLSPLPALIIQSISVTAVNVTFDTPNLWLTVAPSIIFSAIYGYAYSVVLAKKHQRVHTADSHP